MADAKALVARLADAVDRGQIGQAEAAHYLGKFLCRRLYCSRAAMWTIAPAGRGAAIVRVGGFDARADRPLVEPLSIAIEPGSDWLAELLAQGQVVSDDTLRDPRLRGLRLAHLADQRIGALLHAALAYSGGRPPTLGFIACEQLGAPRAWRAQDAQRLREVARAVDARRALRLAQAG